jgi:hypothetical protein
MSATIPATLPRPEDLEYIDGVSIARFSIDDYHEMIEQGFFNGTDAFELLDGFLVKKMARNPPHDSTVQKLDRRFKRWVPAKFQLRVQLGITLDNTEPEPDLAIVLGNETDFDHQHPWAEAVKILVEVSDSTLATDRGWKASLYAKAGILVYWVVNIPDRRIEVYSQPESGQYLHRDDYGEDDSVPILLNDTVYGTIAVSEVLPTNG